MAVQIIPGELDLETFIAAVNGAEVSLPESAYDAVARSRQVVEQVIASDRVVYGVNTGFGALKNRQLHGEHLERLQENLVISHAVGMGALLPKRIVRGMMILRLASLARGFSGVRVELIQQLLSMINAGIHPLVPEDGSVGASGDLAPLAHIAMAVIGRGECEFKGETMPAKKALEAVGLKPLVLQAKEGLALTNGTQLMTTQAALLLHEQTRLYTQADIIAAMSIEAGIGTRVSCDPRIHQLRPHPGQARSANLIWNALSDSAIMRAHKNCDKLQDQYSFRCTPQVHGSAWQGLEEKRNTILCEMNSVTDNPLVFPDGEVLSGGNFHGGTIARVLGEFGAMMAGVGAISEKRIEYLLDPKSGNGLPGFLVGDAWSSGFMIPQYVAAAYVAENSKLSSPLANLTGISTSAGQEDHVSMGPIDGKYALKILENTRRILAIEYLCAAQALDLQEERLKASPSSVTSKARALLRLCGVPNVNADCEFRPFMLTAEAILRDGMLLKAIR